MNFKNILLTFEENWSEDKIRKSYLLNLINAGLFIFLVSIIAIRILGEMFFNASSNKESFVVLFSILLLLSFMIFLVKKGFVRIVAFSILILLLASSLKGSFTWGLDLYTVDMMYPLIILLSAILISSKFSFFMLFIICFNLSLIFILQENGYSFASSAWKLSTPSFLNLLTILLIYTLMTFLSWLSSREIEKSLNKSRILASKLKMQNENLEQIVEERTKELKVLQLNQLTRIAPLLDLGKLSAGLIHDVREPLAVLSFIMQNASQNKNIVKDLDEAFLAINKIDELSKMSACQLFSEPELEIFNLNQEIKKIISLFEYKTRLRKVRIIFETNKEYDLHADRSKLNQVIANLILNSLEAYEFSESKEKYIFIKLIKKPRNLLIKIKDYGIGINQENLIHIFEPNFSSKDNKEFLGFGLYVSQEAMKKVFESRIGFESEAEAGSEFTLFIKNKFILNEFAKSH